MTSKRFIYYLLAAFITGNLLLIFMQYNSARNIDNLILGNEKLLNEVKTGTGLRELEKDITALENNMRGILAMEDTTVPAGLERQIREVKADMDYLQQVSDDDSTMKYVDELNPLVQAELKNSRDLIDTFRATGHWPGQTKASAWNSKKLMDSIAFVMHKVDSSRQVLLTKVTQSIDASGRQARRWGTILIAIVLVSAAVLFWYIINRIGRQNQLIRQLDTSEKKEREAAQVKENFLANMSHEIRTPLNAILGFTGLLEKKKLDNEAQEYVSTIRLSGENLLALVNDILDLSRIEAGMMHLESQPFSVRGLFQSVETMFREKTNEKDLLFSVKIDDAVPDTLEGDAVRLTQILVNLIGNAVKFTQRGSITVLVEAKEVEAHRFMLAVTVNDTGIGIEKDKLAGVFDRFRQAEDSITRKYGGTGLGLAIVKDLVTMQGGNIDLLSEPGLGTSFRLKIPYKIAAHPQPPGAYTGEKDNGIFQPDIKVLIVEDNEINQSLMKHLMRNWGIGFDLAVNGNQAVELLRKKTYDLILMDIQMPQLDGYSATRVIRDELGLLTPIVAMTAHALAGERERCLSSGMDEYIPKPVREQQLRNLIIRFTSNNGKQVAPHVNGHPAMFKYIDLGYMKEISGGDMGYEKIITGQFLELVPSDLRLMQDAFGKNELQRVRDLAHNLKTSVSVMGLTASLSPVLDSIGQSEDPDLIKRQIDILVTYCQSAIVEAKQFYESLPG